MLDTLSPKALICVFCEGIVQEEVGHCVPCHEYKGVTTVREYKEMWS